MVALASLVIALGGILLLLSPAAIAAVRTWSQSPSFEHGYLIVAVSATLVWFDRHRLAPLAPQPWFWGLSVVACAAALAAVGNAGTVVLVEQLALVALISATVLTVLGPAIARRLRFALAYLLFAVPMGAELVPFLRYVTGKLIVGLLSLAGVTANLDGYLVRLPTADFRIAEACAGLRFFLVSLAASVLAAHFLLRSWRRRLAYMAIAALLPIAGNAFRAALLISLADQGVLDPQSVYMHFTYGLGFTGILLVVLMVLAFVLRDAGDQRRAMQKPLPVAGPTRAGLVQFPIAAGAVVLLVALATARSLAPGAAPNLSLLYAPSAMAPWIPVESNSVLDDLEDNGADQVVTQSYEAGGLRLDLRMAFYANQQHGAEAVSELNRPEAIVGWAEVQRYDAVLELEGGTLPVTVVVLERQGRRLAIWSWYWVDGAFVGNAVAAKLRQVRARLLSGRSEAAWIAVSVPDEGNETATAATLQNWLAHAKSLSAVLIAASGK